MSCFQANRYQVKHSVEELSRVDEHSSALASAVAALLVVELELGKNKVSFFAVAALVLALTLHTGAGMTDKLYDKYFKLCSVHHQTPIKFTFDSIKWQQCKVKG